MRFYKEFMTHEKRNEIMNVVNAEPNSGEGFEETEAGRENSVVMRAKRLRWGICPFGAGS